MLDFGGAYGVLGFQFPQIYMKLTMSLF
ncbi:BnaA01g19070D [Brassica napus]|uniref:BnaA01g19070D protein n=1 Tax=Brassica napus TaxID=3708 RepID=A0A078GX73_BRANA|nr:BnaA01g19070D [Brassica napus]